MQQQLTASQASELYLIMNKIDPSHPDLMKHFSSINVKKPEEATKLLKKIAVSSSEKDFVDFILKNEIPAIKLTDSEMETLKGGVLPLVAWYIISGAAGLGLAAIKSLI